MEDSMTTHGSQEEKEVQPLYFYRYHLVDVVQEFLYMQRKEMQGIDSMLKTSRGRSLIYNLGESSESFDSDIFKCYKFHL